MNTPTHLILGALAFGKADKPRVTLAAVAGGLAPDLSLYLLSSWAMYVSGHSAEVVFDQLYFSDSWQAIFAIDNSFILWGLLFAAAVWRKWPLVFAFAGAAILHLLLDFPLHGDDARSHFWPLTNWKFESPVSYWDPHRHGGVMSLIELVIAVIACLILWWRHKSVLARVIIGLALVAIVAPGIIWAIVFS